MMAAEVGYCVPVWDDVTFDYKRNSELVKECRFDHGMMGVDVIKNTNGFDIPLTASYAKSYRQMCFHSVTPAMPCVSPETISKYFLENLNLTKTEKMRQATIRKELIKFKSTKRYKQYTDMIDLLLEDPVYVPDDSLPSFLKRYKKVFVKTPDKECYWQHHRSALTTLDVGRNHYALFSGGENLNKLRKLPLSGDWTEETQVHNLKTKCMKTFASENGPILQITTKKVQNSILGALRQRTKCHLYKLNDKCKLESINTLTTDDKFNPIIDVAPSPFIAGEFVYLTQNGCVQTIKLDTDVATDVNKSLLNHQQPPTSVHFGPHPRSVISTSPTQMRLADLRASCLRSLPLLTLPDVTLPPHDTICSTTPFVGNDDVSVVTTTTSVLLLDQRYPGRYFLKWSHLLQHPPEMTSVRALSRANDEVIILTGSTRGQDVALIHAERSNSSAVYTRCPTMHLSRPKDLLRFLPRGETHPVASLVSAPLIGIDLFSIDSFQSATVLQLTASGNMFAQNVTFGAENGSESEWRVGPGMEPNAGHESDYGVAEWADERGEKVARERKTKKPKGKLDASGLGAALRFPDDRGMTEGAVNANALDAAMLASQIFAKDDENSDNSAFGLQEVDVMDYDDEISVKLADVWMRSEIEDDEGAASIQ